MSDELRSILLGTSGLSVLVLVSMIVAAARPPRDGASSGIHRVRRLAAIAIAAQSMHVLEEGLTGFHVRFPELLGLAPWSASFFIGFNFFWILVWVVCAAFLPLTRASLFPLWFLAIASTLNGVAHPILSFQTGGYFPGLWTSPLVGLAGLLLLRSMDSLTRRPTPRVAV